MLFLLLFALMSSEYVERSWVAGGSVSWAITLWVAAAVGLVYGLAWLLARRTAGQMRHGAGGTVRPVMSHHRLLWGLRGLMAGLHLGLVFSGRWPAFVYDTLRLRGTVIIDNWMVILPFVLMVVAHWIPLYRVDLLLRRRQASVSDIAPRSGVALEPFRPWTLRQYLGMHLRHQVWMALVPVSVALAGLEGLEHLLVAVNLTGGVVYLVSMVAFVLGLYVVSPLFMRVIWQTRPLPAGPLRRRLEALCRRTGLSYRNLLLWRTQCDLVNAAVAGLVGGLRYIFLSDGLLRHLEPDQIEAVFGHEIGHVKYRHLPLYFVFVMGSLVFVVLLHAVTYAVVRALGGSSLLYERLTGGWAFILGVLALYWGVFFGFLSRRFERQADVFGVRAVQAEGGHPATRQPTPLDPVAVGAFARALENVASLNGMTRRLPGFSHFSIERRIHFLEQALVDPRVEWQFQRSLRRLKLGWLVATIAGLVLLGALALLPERHEAAGAAEALRGAGVPPPAGHSAGAFIAPPSHDRTRSSQTAPAGTHRQSRPTAVGRNPHRLKTTGLPVGRQVTHRRPITARSMAGHRFQELVEFLPQLPGAAHTEDEEFVAHLTMPGQAVDAVARP